MSDTEVPATRRSESAGEDPSARGKSWKIENPNKNDEELQDDELQGVYLWSREQKWYRVNITF